MAMNIEHQITLPSSAWEDLYNALSHFDAERQERIDSFFSEIEEEVPMTHSSNQIFVESEEIDEETILKLLQEIK